MPRRPNLMGGPIDRKGYEGRLAETPVPATSMKEVFGQDEEARGNGKFVVIVHAGDGDFVYSFGPFGNRAAAERLMKEIEPLCDSGALYEAEVQVQELHDGPTWQEVLRDQRNDLDDGTGSED